ncbi:MAG TPA: hypothetical protein VGJ95_06450 [Pseudonocardiaceae bacterium]|jgi:hypothetical protein
MVSTTLVTSDPIAQPRVFSPGGGAPYGGPYGGPCCGPYGDPYPTGGMGGG